MARLVGLEALQLHSPFAAEEAPGDLGAAALLQGLLHQAADRGALLALPVEIQDCSLQKSDSWVSKAPLVNRGSPR
jgi:hypothetical protein